MRNFNLLSNLALHERTVRFAKLEQRASRELLSHLHEIRKRRVYAERGYSTLWEYCVKGLGFDESAASQKIRAMELVTTVPEAKRQFNEGTLSITKAAAVQCHIRSQAVIDRQAKTEILLQVRNCSVRATRETLKKLAEPAALPIQRGTFVGFEADEELQKMFTRFRELKGQMQTVEMMKHVFRAYLKQIDPLEKPAKLQAPKLDTSQDAGLARGDEKAIQSLVLLKVKTEKSCNNNAQQNFVFHNLINNKTLFDLNNQNPESEYIAIDIRRAAAQRAQGQCEWVSPITGRRCECRYKLQYDHRLPRKLGGTSTLENIQLICAVHNGWRTRHLGR